VASSDGIVPSNIFELSDKYLIAFKLASSLGMVP